ncbi:unnamed protein product, partial [Ilex paraguariensis]
MGRNCGEERAPPIEPHEHQQSLVKIKAIPVGPSSREENNFTIRAYAKRVRSDADEISLVHPRK